MLALVLCVEFTLFLGEFAMFNTAEERQSHLESLLVMARSIDSKAPCAQLDTMFFGKIDGKNICASVELPNDNAKDGLVQKLYGMILQNRLEDGFSLMFESWVTSPDFDADPAEMLSIPGNIRPHTTEKIVVSFVYPDDEMMFMSDIHVVRGKRIYSEFKEMPGMKQGRFAQIYKMARAAMN